MQPQIADMSVRTALEFSNELTGTSQQPSGNSTKRGSEDASDCVCGVCKTVFQWLRKCLLYYALKVHFLLCLCRHLLFAMPVHFCAYVTRVYSCIHVFGCDILYSMCECVTDFSFPEVKLPSKATYEFSTGEVECRICFASNWLNSGRGNMVAR